MTFDEILEQVITLLKRQGRVSYRALKMRFDLDDEYLDTLKEEILYVHESAVQADDRGFTWAGEAEETTVSAFPPPQTPKPPTAQETQPTHEPPLESHPREAERRQLTVMFCDLVDSTKLSSQLDPEDYREVVREYQKVCSEVITRYDGYIAQYLGDGLLVYFGYPVAHEEDAQRATHTGLGIVAAMQNLNTRLESDKGARLAVRLGIHTGLVVVGEMGGAGRQEQLALGETPNIAARIQGLAEPNTVVISSSTYRLVQGYFDCQELGEQNLRGVAEPITVYRVLGETGTQSRIDIAATRGLTPLVGREQEVGLLIERWEQAKTGQGQVILLAHNLAIRLHRFLREWQTVLEQAGVLMTLVSEQGYAQLVAACVRDQGMALAAQGQVAKGLTMFRQGLMDYRATGAVYYVPLFLVWLADICGQAGEVEEGLLALTEALTVIETTGERVSEAELYRLKGELLLTQSPDNAAEAESCFHKAIAIAQNQSAKSWELRAATSLAKLWQRQGKCQEANDLLAPVYGWFTEGFDTADLKDAKALLNELEDGRS